MHAIRSCRRAAAAWDGSRTTYIQSRVETWGSLQNKNGTGRYDRAILTFPATMFRARMLWIVAWASSRLFRFTANLYWNNTMVNELQIWLSCIFGARTYRASRTRLATAFYPRRQRYLVKNSFFPSNSSRTLCADFLRLETIFDSWHTIDRTQSVFRIWQIEIFSLTVWILCLNYGN